MARQVAFNHVDTAISGVTTNSTAIGLVNFGADFRVERKTADEAVLTNMRSPLGSPEKFRTAYSVVADVYKNTGIEPGVQSQTKRGVSVLNQHTDIAAVTDTTDVTVHVDLPFSASIVFKIPMSPDVTDAIILTYIQRTLAALFETGQNTAARLGALARGGLLPLDVI